VAMLIKIIKNQKKASLNEIKKNVMHTNDVEYDCRSFFLPLQSSSSDTHLN